MSRIALAVLVACLAVGCGLKPARPTDPAVPNPAPAVGDPSGPAGGDAIDLLAARKGFTTRVSDNPNYTPDGPADQPPAKLFRVVRYPSAVGPLVAYLSPDPGDGKKRPAVVYAHGGFGGINGIAFGREAFAPFRDAGFVLFCPSWRGENDNPGRYEMFYGEVDDALESLRHLAAVPYVDPDRIYMIGHSTGGTVTLLTAEANPRLRAAFSFGGAPDLARADYGNTPFNRATAGEVRLRSAINFVGGLKTPTFYFEGDRNPDGRPYEGYLPDARRMQAAADAAGVPFRSFVVHGGTHYNIVRPLSTLLAAKLRTDTGPRFELALTAAEVDRAFAAGGR